MLHVSCCTFVLLLFPRTLEVPQREKPLLLWGFPLLFPKKRKGWRVREVGFGEAGRKRKGFWVQQCGWRKHGFCGARLAEARLPKLETQNKSRRLWRSQRRISRSGPEGGPIFQQPFSLHAQTLAGIAVCVAGKSENTFPAASKFAGKLFQQRISDSHSLLEFSDKHGQIQSTILTETITSEKQKSPGFRIFAFLNHSGVVRQSKPKKGRFMNFFERANLNQNSMWIVLVSPKKHPNSQKRVRFINFLFRTFSWFRFFWFRLPGWLPNHESGSENKFVGFWFRKCGLLLWLVRAQHNHYESKCERKAGGKHLLFHYESESENEIPRFSFVIASVRMVEFFFAILEVPCTQHAAHGSIATSKPHLVRSEMAQNEKSLTF